MSTFDTADVVRGPGADAPSIVDSIGGSFVLHPPGRVEKNPFEFSVSNDPYGGVVSNAKAEFHFGRLSATITYGINNSPGPLGSRNVIAAYSWPLVTENGQTFQGCGTSYYFGCSTYVYPSGPPQYTNGNYVIQSALLLDGAPINTAWTQHSGSIALLYDITPSITAQVFYAGLSSGMATPGAEYLVNFVPAVGYTGSLPAGLYHFVYAFGEESEQASSLLEEKLTAYVGRGVVRVAALQNNSFVQEPTSNRLPNGQYTLYGTGYVGTTSPGTLTAFNGTPANLVFSPLSDNFAAWVNNRDILASYATQIGSRLNVGLSYVTSYYNYPYEYESSSYSYSQPTATSETTTEIRLHAGVAVSDKLNVDASWYFAKGTYHVQNPNDPTGNTWAGSTFPYSAPRIGVVWNAGRDIAIRAAAGGGYALPVLSNLVGHNAVYLCGPFYQDYKTNLNLTPEKSFGFDLGTDIRLHHDTVLSFDLYHTNLYGQFFSSTTLTGTYLGLPLYTSQYENLGQSRFEGINIDIHHDVSKGIYWHGALGLTRAYVVSFPAGFYNTASCSNCANTYIVPGINFDGEFQSTVPYANGSAEVGYRWAPGKYIDLAPTYYGNNNEYFRPAFIEFDAHAGYALTKNVSLLATFRNITGIYGQDYELVVPATGAPSVVGAPYPLYGLP